MQVVALINPNFCKRHPKVMPADEAKQDGERGNNAKGNLTEDKWLSFGMRATKYQDVPLGVGFT